MSVLARLRDAKTRRWLRYARRAVWLLLLAMFAWYAVVRWTTPPAAVARGTGVDDRAATEAHELCDLLTALPQFTTQFTTGGLASPMMRASFGMWTRERVLIQDVLAYLSDPATERALDQLSAACAAHPPDAAAPATSDRVRGSQTSYYLELKRREAVAALTVRARYRAAEAGDLTGALADLRAALQLAERYEWMESDWTLWSGRRGTVGGLTLLEWVRTALERPLPREVAREMIAFFHEELSLSAADTVSRAARLEDGGEALLDRYYTDDGRGNGWLVLSQAAPAMRSFPFLSPAGNPGESRSGFWNLFAPLFNDRATLLVRLQQQRAAVARLDSLAAPGLAPALYAAGIRGPEYGGPIEVLEGPLAECLPQLNVESLCRLHHEVAWRRAVVVMLGLAAYRHDHGTYPATLDDLVPEYLDSLPIDLNAQAPFVYERLSATRCRLGSELTLEFANLLLDVHGLAEPRGTVYSIDRPEEPW